MPNLTGMVALTKNSPKADKILLEGIPKEGTPSHFRA